MSHIKIKTDYKWKDLKYDYQVPKAVLRRQFGWMQDPSDYKFLKYRTTWYCLADFMRLDGQTPEFKGWHGGHGDSYFSGTLIQLSDDGEQYRIGTYTQIGG